MKKEEYLHKALLLVSNPYTKAQVQRELEDHIEDETSFYTDAGYEREKAENMAMSRMGAPEEMARELGRLHRNLPGRMLGFSALAACVGLSVLYGFSEQWSYSLYAVMPDWLVYTLQFGNVLAVLQPPPWPFAGRGSARTRCCWLGTVCFVLSVALPSIFYGTICLHYWLVRSRM